MKGNEESMILWFKTRCDTEFIIKKFELKDGKGHFEELKIKNSIGLAYNH